MGGDGSDAPPYEAVPYPGGTLAQTHPDRLSSLARLFAVTAPLPSRCRVLEIGCGDGANLLAMAQSLPLASFVGIDTSPRAIAAASARAGELGLGNARFEEISLTDYDVDAGGLDFVVAHGVYSWVPEAVRDALLGLCTRALCETGVAYVSYNTLPGGRLREILRDLLLRHVGAIEDPQRRLAAARELLVALRAAWAYDPELGTMVGLATRMLEGGDALLFHDTLAPINVRLRFEDFAAHAARHDLQYLAEANYWEMQLGWLPRELRTAALEHGDRLAREGLLDELRMRTFRQTLLCHAARQVGEPAPQRLEALAVASQATSSAGAPEGAVTFTGASGASLTTDHRLVIGALQRVTQAWPAALAVASLWPPDAGAEHRAVICEALLRCYGGALVELRAEPSAA